MLIVIVFLILCQCLQQKFNVLTLLGKSFNRCLFKKYRSVVVEGSYGWLTQLTRNATFASWAESHRMPVILLVVKD